MDFRRTRLEALHCLKEHRQTVSRNITQLMVEGHASTAMHVIDWENTKVVHGYPHYRQRCALEAGHIRTEPHKMNRDGGCCN